MSQLLRVWAMLLALCFTISIAGCAEEDGPAEKFGESVDEAVEEVEDEIDDAT